MAQTAKPETEKATDIAKNTTDRAAEQAADTTREATERVEDVARHGLHVVQRTTDALSEVQREVAQRSAEHTAELGWALVDLLQEQARRNLETLAALVGAVDWDQVARIQSEYLRVSLERGARLAQRYLEVGQAVATATADAAQPQAREAA